MQIGFSSFILLAQNGMILLKAGVSQDKFVAVGVKDVIMFHTNSGDQHVGTFVIPVFILSSAQWDKMSASLTDSMVISSEISQEIKGPRLDIFVT